jgi:hypothetical protein
MEAEDDLFSLEIHMLQFEQEVQTNIMAVPKDTLLSFVEPRPYNPSHKLTDVESTVYISPLFFKITGTLITQHNGRHSPDNT